LREVLWQKAIHFIIETANMVGHDNLDDNRVQYNGGSIANINANQTFTHAPDGDYFNKNTMQ
jgi:hypothetical protein